MNVEAHIPPISESAFERHKPQDIRLPAFQYSLRAIKLHQHLQGRRDGAAWVLGKQYLRSACSVGANIEESQSGESRADFIHKLGIAEKEARESLYWLRLIAESGIVQAKKLDPLMKETEELIAVLASIILSTKGKKAA
ncbi:MAG: four helix bundle protein [Terriglobia bacterium]